MKTKKVSYQEKEESPNPKLLELYTLYTIEYISEKEVMEELRISSFTLRKWYELGLNRYKIDDKKFIKKSELNKFIDGAKEKREEVQHVNPALL